MKKVRGDEEPINKKELEICKRRRHKVLYATMGWEQCEECKIWVREKATLEELEERPTEDVY